MHHYLFIYLYANYVMWARSKIRQRRFVNREEFQIWKENLKPFGYELIQIAGRGSYGVVFQALDQQDNKMVAIKICLKKERGEAVHWPNLHHPHIITLYRTFIINQNYIYVMEFASNGTVGNWVKKMKVTKSLVRKWLWQVIRTLAYLHSNGYYHLDVKLNNILLDEKMNIKIADFGKLCSKGEMSFHLGAPTYRPPELKKNSYSSVSNTAGPWLEKIDAFCVGACFLRLTTRKSVLDDKIWKNLAVVHDPEMVEILTKLLEKNPKKRYTCKKARRHKWKFKAKRTRIVYICQVKRLWNFISFCSCRHHSTQSVCSSFLSSSVSSSLTTISGSIQNQNSSKFIKSMDNETQQKNFGSYEPFEKKFSIPRHRFQFPKFNTSFPIVNYLRTQLAIPLSELGAYSDLD